MHFDTESVDSGMIRTEIYRSVIIFITVYMTIILSRIHIMKSWRDIICTINLLIVLYMCIIGYRALHVDIESVELNTLSISYEWSVHSLVIICLTVFIPAYKLDTKTVPVLRSLHPSLIFPFNFFTLPGAPYRIFLYIFSGFLANCYRTWDKNEVQKNNGG